MSRVQKNYIYFKQKSFLLIILIHSCLIKVFFCLFKSYEPKVLNRSVILKSVVHLKMFYTHINHKKRFCLEHFEACFLS